MDSKRYDLHSHTMYSPDSILRPKRSVQCAIKRGLSGIAITDHNTIKGGLAAKQYATPDFEVIVGAEMRTNKGEVIGLFLNEEIKSRDLFEVFDEIRAQDGIIIIPHPFDTVRNGVLHPTAECVKYIDAIEGFNARCVSQIFNDDAQIFAVEHKLAMTGGSDAHCANEIGYAYTQIHPDFSIRDAILERHTVVEGSRTPIINHAFTKVIRKCKRNFGCWRAL